MPGRLPREQSAGLRYWKFWLPAAALILYGAYSFYAGSIYIPGRGPRTPVIGVARSALSGHTFAGSRARGMSLAFVALGAGLIGMAEGTRRQQEKWIFVSTGLMGSALLGFLYSLVALTG